MSENHVTYRGSMKDTNIIQLPAEWQGKVDLETISIQLTPIGGYQELFVEKLEWAQRVIVKTASASKIHCYYTINATLL
tara:strand:- start:470 stop:706 length:237 start_codon:yes stop_codon:yes gene_type:complete